MTMLSYRFDANVANLLKFHDSAMVFSLKFLKIFSLKKTIEILERISLFFRIEFFIEFALDVAIEFSLKFPLENCDSKIECTTPKLAPKFVLNREKGVF